MLLRKLWLKFLSGISVFLLFGGISSSSYGAESTPRGQGVLQEDGPSAPWSSQSSNTLSERKYCPSSNTNPFIPPSYQTPQQPYIGLGYGQNPSMVVPFSSHLNMPLPSYIYPAYTNPFASSNHFASSNGASHYQAKVEEDDSGYKRPSDTIARGTNIEVLVLGQTGSGKTTFLNTVANYFLFGSFVVGRDSQDIKVIIPTRFLKPNVPGFSHSELDVSDQAKSQTSKPKPYRLGLSDRSITFVDTPGMGDTGGIDRDEEHLKNILYDASKRGKLSGIILFFNGSEPRDTATKVYTFNKLKGSIPDVAVKNMIVVLTNTHKESSSFPLQSLLELGMTEDRIFYMNNSVLASDPNTWKNLNTAKRLAQDWEESMITVGNICEKISGSSNAISEEFKRMRKLRNLVMREFHQVRLKFAEIQEAHNTIELYKAKYQSQNALADDFKDFAEKATIKSRKFVADPGRHYSTVCSVHNTICHDVCSLTETHTVGDQVFAGCWAFNGTSGRKCRECSTSQPCSYANHYHARGRFMEVTETLQERLEEYKKVHEQASSAAQSAQADLDSAQEALAQIEKAIDRFAKEVERKLEEMKGICKGYNFVAELNTTIQLLKQEARNYTSMQALTSANNFIAALELMAERLTEQGFAQGVTGNSPDTSEFYQVTAEELSDENHKKGVFSYVKGGLGKLGKRIDKSTYSSK